MKAIGIIPARFASTRFPGKALVDIAGKTMIRRVFEQASSCSDLSRVVVATDNEKIAEHVADFGGCAIMTSSFHRSGTERCAEALALLQESERDNDAEVVVNIQGDEPFINPLQISELLSCFQVPGVNIATLAKIISSEKEINDPNVVKVVFDKNFRVSYFSRAAVPYKSRAHQNDPDILSIYYRHVGLYAYTRNTLLEIVRLPESPAEKSESLEQLRWIYHGYPIHIQITEHESVAIDTPADLLKITNKDW